MKFTLRLNLAPGLSGPTWSEAAAIAASSNERSDEVLKDGSKEQKIFSEAGKGRTGRQRGGLEPSGGKEPFKSFKFKSKSDCQLFHFAYHYIAPIIKFRK